MKYKVYLGGEFLGYTKEPKKLAEKIRKLRREGKISYQVNVAVLDWKKEVRINIDSGRIRRPAIIAEKYDELMKLLKEGKIKSFEDLIGYIEFLDAEEEENCLISIYPTKDKKFTHVEIHPAIILGLHASLIPFVEYNRGDRINYGAKMSGQGGGIYNLAFKSRADSKTHYMLYTQVPLVKTVATDIFPFDTHPIGNNVVVAIISHPYSMQDAIVINKSSVERGLFWNYLLRTYEAEEKKYPSGQEDVIGIPIPGVKGYRGEEAYKNLDTDGIIFPETKVEGSDVLIGKISPLRFIGTTTQFIISAENMRETSVELRHEDKGIVDRVFITTTSEGNKLVKVVVRDLKVPEIGDKFATRHGQKGVIGLLVKQEDMPFTESGIVPDIILNPHAIPSRMTIGQLLEIVAGKIGAIRGEQIDATAFEGIKEEELVKMLKELGFEEDGREIMYDPRTGKKYEVRILVGICFYMKLVDHLVSNKMHVRTRGPVTLLTRQPTEGRIKEGGLRLGEMEKDVLIAHGASVTLKERFDSDKVSIPVCAKCGLIAYEDKIRNRYWCNVCDDNSEIVLVEMAYAFKLLLQELISMHIYPKLIVDKTLGKIVGIEFGVLSPEIIKKLSVAKINKVDVYDEEGYPIEGGIMDPRMGTIDPGIKCRTCGGNYVTCPGHFGHVELAKPVIHPLFVRHIYTILRVFCKKCYKLLTTEEKPKLKNLLKSLPSTCPHCKTKQPKIELMKPYTFKIDGKEMEREELREFLIKISDEDLKKIGIRVRPEWFILSTMLVPPPCVRPSIVLETGERSEDDLTHKLVDIVRINERFKETLQIGAPEFIIKDLWELLQYHVATYFDNELSGIPPARHRSGRVLKTLAQRLETKEGRFRYNLLGKRTNFSARSVISPDPYIDIDEVGVPEIFAKQLTVPISVNEENIGEIRKMLLNYPNWPSINYVIAPDGTRIKVMEKNKEELAKKIAAGWIVERHLLNGDYVLFNRQPSLHRMSIMAHRVRVMSGKTFRINLCTTIPYNADFDGDEMNLHVPQSIEAMAEASILMNVIKHIRSPRYGGPIIALLHDQISGLFLLTYGEKKIKFEDAVQLIREIDLNVEIPRKEFLTGKEIFSFFLPKISLEFKGSLASIGDEEGNIVIKDGKLIKGAIDKKAVGENGKLLNRILTLFGEYYTKEFIEKISKLGMNYLRYHGFSISYADYRIFEGAKKKIDNLLNKTKEKVNELIDKFKRGELKAIIGKTEKETLEQLINSEISNLITEVTKIIINEVNRNSEIFIMAASGARGSLINIVQISGMIGQEKIKGERIEIGYYLRTFPHFERGDISLEAKGFVPRGFREGLKPLELYFELMNSREALMDKSVKTRQSGYLERRFIGALQDLKVEYDGTIRDSSGNIIQFIAGEDGIDPYKVEGGDINIESLISKI